MHALNKIIIHGWPTQKSKLPQSLHPFWSYRVELTTHDGIVYKGKQVVIPQSKRNYMLQKAHVAHFGPESIIRHCKDIISYHIISYHIISGMRSYIQSACQSCGTSARFQTQNSKDPWRANRSHSIRGDS